MVLRVGIVGCGNVAWRYAKIFSDLNVGTHVKAIIDNEQTALTALLDLKIDHMHELQSFHSFNTKICTSIDEFLKLELDVVSICVNTDQHKSIVKRLIDGGIKNIWLEKPSFTTREDYDEIIKISRERNVRIQVNYQRLFDPVQDQIAKLLETQHRLSIYGIYSLELLRNGVHLLALISKLTGICKIEIQNLSLDVGGMAFHHNGRDIFINMLELPIDYHVLELKIYTPNYIFAFDDKCMKYKIFKILFAEDGFKKVIEIQSGNFLPTQKLFNSALENLISDKPLISPVNIDNLLISYLDVNF